MTVDGEHTAAVNINPFPTLVGQSFALDAMANQASAGDAPVLAKASITTTALGLECAAYCCFRRVKMSGELVERLHRGLPSLDKYDLLHWICTKRPLDRGNRHVRQAKELLSLRNSLVHPKVVRKTLPVKKHVRVGDEATFDPQIPPLEMLKIPGDERTWGPEHSRLAIIAALEFFNFFFVDACKSNVTALSAILCTSSGTACFLTPWERQMLALAPTNYGVPIRFLNVKSSAASGNT